MRSATWREEPAVVSKILLSSYTYNPENKIQLGSPEMLTHDYITDDLKMCATRTINTLQFILKKCVLHTSGVVFSPFLIF